MKELENLKELYLEEIKKINKKGELTPADGEAAKKALEAIEKINEICSEYEEEEGYSERMYGRHYPMRAMNRERSMMPDMMYGRGSYGYGEARDGGSYGYGYSEARNRSYGDGYSERRGRDSMGRYTSRSRGESVDHMIHKLEDLKMDAPDNRMRMAIDDMISKLEAY